MAPSVPTIEPDVLYAGATAKWTRSLADYPASDGWSLIYTFRGPSQLEEQVARPSGSDFAITIQADDTEDLLAGTYSWTARVELNGEVYVVARGVLTVVLFDGAVEQLHEEKVIAVCEAALEGRLTADMQSYAVDGKQVTKIPVEELERILTKYRWKLWHRRNPGKLSTPVAVNFSRPGAPPAAPEPVVLPWWYAGAR